MRFFKWKNIGEVLIIVFNIRSISYTVHFRPVLSRTASLYFGAGHWPETEERLHWSLETGGEVDPVESPFLSNISFHLQITPYLGGLGLASGIVAFNVALYYNTIIAWCLKYFVKSFYLPLPWSRCPTEEETSPENYQECQVGAIFLSLFGEIFKIFYFHSLLDQQVCWRSYNRSI